MLFVRIYDRTRWSLFNHLNSFPPSAAYLRQLIGSALVQIMAWRLFGAKPLSKPMLGYCQLDPWEQTLVKWALRITLQWLFNQNASFWFTEMHLEISSAKWRPFCSRGDELTHILLVPHMCVNESFNIGQIMASRLFGARPLSKPMLG